MVDDSKGVILRALRIGPKSSTEVAAILGISRQAVHRHLKRLVAAGEIVKVGAARATRYQLRVDEWKRRFDIAGLAEDRVFGLLASEHPLLRALKSPALDTINYVVTELVNNAIDHSAGEHVSVRAEARGAMLELTIEDDGVGAFAHVATELALSSELEAIQEISKGKTTTAPERHSGEGLFFVSKAVDLFRLESGSLAWIVDNLRGDAAIGELAEARDGTLAFTMLDTAHPRDLTSLFAEYTEDYEFSKTRVVIELFTIGSRFISRSEAKRLMHGLDRFREVVLDFKGVDAVGQGFADQVFRVWARAHPDVTLTPIQMNDSVAFMVERARRY